MWRNPRTVVLSVFMVGALLIAGCGGGGSPDEVVTEIFDAAAEEDWGAVCERLTDEAIQQALDSTGAETCEEAQEAETAELPDGFLEDAEIGEATEDGETATVELSYEGATDEVDLRKVDGDWLGD